MDVARCSTPIEKESVRMNGSFIEMNMLPSVIVLLGYYYVLHPKAHNFYSGKHRDIQHGKHDEQEDRLIAAVRY